jgi:phage shock protein A
MFKRLINLIRGFFGRFVSGLEKQNPEALLELEKENLRKQIANYNQGLAAHAGLCEKLVAQIKRQEAEERDLSAKALANLKVGNKDAAAQYALRLQTVRRELEENRAQARQAEQTYQELVRARDVAVKSAQTKIESLKYAIDDMRIKKATAELTELATGMITHIGGSGDTMDRLHQVVEEERTKAAGRARVARDSLDLSEVNVKEAEQKALADAALAEFAAQAGIALEPPTPAAAAPAVKEAIGPTAEPQRT